MSFHALSLSSFVSLGSPKTLSAIILRIISDVPPSIELALDLKNKLWVSVKPKVSLSKFNSG